MTAVFCAPTSFSVASGSEGAVAPARNLNTDPMGLVWRSTGLLGVQLTISLADPSFDTVALVGSNLRAGDTIRVRAGSSASVVAGETDLLLDATVPAWTGTAPTSGALTVLVLDAPIAASFVRLDLTSSGNPDGYVEASRLIIGKRVQADGIDIGCEQTFEDGSDVQEGLGFTTVDEYRVRIGWKVSVSGVKEADYWAKWFPFLRSIGRHKGFLFLPDSESDHVQTQAVFGRMANSAKGSAKSSDFTIIDMTILSV